VRNQIGRIIGIGLLGILGCAGSPQSKNVSTDPVEAMLEQGITELTVHIDELSKDLQQLKQMPLPKDPLLQELQGLDLAGWQLYYQQWLLQREHLLFAAEQIRKTHAAPGEKARLREEWANRHQQFVTALNDLRTQRQELERKRLDVEAKLLERYFQ
jgi:hypothetical protein